MSDKKIRLALLAGGKSGERDVSLKGAEGVVAALDPEKYSVRRYDPATDLARLANDAPELDVAFILLHGLYGEDGTVQGFLELLGLPYQGSGVLGSAIAMDKDLAKQMYQKAALPVAAWQMLNHTDADNPAPVIESLGLPLVIKPVRQGSSLGMSIARDQDGLAAGIRTAFEHDNQVMAEQFIEGREITVGVIGNDQLSALPLVEIIPGDQYAFFDYEAKYQPGASTEICPADISPDLAAQAQEYAIRAHQALKLRGYSRTDMMVRENGELFLLETNTIPGMTPTSLLPQAAAEFGLPFDKLLDRLIDLAMEG